MLRLKASPLPPRAPEAIWSQPPASKQPLHPGWHQSQPFFPKCFTDRTLCGPLSVPIPVSLHHQCPIPVSLQSLAARGCSSRESLQESLVRQKMVSCCLETHSTAEGGMHVCTDLCSQPSLPSSELSDLFIFEPPFPHLKMQ